MESTLDDGPVETSHLKRNVDKNLLDVFWDLSQIKQSGRVDASISIIRLLVDKQVLAEKAHPEGKSSELEYTVERLVRGLASSRAAARQGFCLTLTQVLKVLPVVTVEDVIKYVEKDLPFHQKLEKCHIVIGRLMAYTAIVKSGRLKYDPYISFIVTNLYDLSNRKSYIQQASYKLMVELYSQLNAERFKELILPHMRKNFSLGWEECTPDTMWYFLLSFRIFPDVFSSKFLLKHWGGEDLFSTDNLKHWQSLLKQSTTAHPQLHPVCSEFLNLAISKKVLQHIWKSVVDDNLFEHDQNEKKTYLGFLMVKEALAKSNKKKRIVKAVLSPRLSSTLIRHYLRQKSSLYPAATELVSYLSTFVNECSDYQIQVMVLQVFLQQPRAALMDQVLKSKEITSMISHFTADAVQAFYEILKNIVFTEYERKNVDDDDGDEDHKRHIAVHQMGILVSHLAILSNVEWRLDVIKFLFLHAFFVVKEPGIENLPECNISTSGFPSSLRQAFESSFTRALDSLKRKIETPLPPLQQFLQFLLAMVEYADNLLQMTDSPLSPLFPSEEILGSWKNMKSLVHKLGKQSKKDGKMVESNAFQILFLQLGLQLFQDYKNMPSILEELEVCCKNALKSRKNQNDTEASEENEGPPWIQVMVDILLSLLSQSSYHMRSVVNSVFPLVCPFVTPEALHLILDVINPEKEKEENPLVNEDDEDVEFESGSSSDEGDENDKDEKVDEQFRSKLGEILGTAVDVSDDDSEGMLTDSEMFKRDDRLSEAFRSLRKFGHTKLSSEQKTLLCFRTKCLDLIFDYLKTEAPMYIVVQIIKPLLSIYEVCRHQRQHDSLSRKALSVLKYISKVKKFKHYENIDESHLEAILNDMINRAHKETDISIGKILYNLCLFTVLCEKKLKALPENGSNSELATLKKYFLALDAFVKRNNSHIIVDMFLIFMNACPEHAWEFMVHLENYAFDESVRLYKKSQCLGLIISALKYSKSQKSITTDMWLRRSEDLVLGTIKALTSMMKDSDIKPLYVTDLLNLLVTIVNILKEKKLSVIQNHSELLPLLMSMTAAQCKGLKNNGKYCRKQLITLLGGDIKIVKDSSENEVPQDEAMDVTENEVRGNGLSKSASSDESGTDSDD